MAELIPFLTVKDDSLEALRLAFLALCQEGKADRFCVMAALAALARQFDRDQFQADFLELAEKLYGEPDEVPPHVRDVGMVILGEKPQKE
jgi:hypothetical protein